MAEDIGLTASACVSYLGLAVHAANSLRRAASSNSCRSAGVLLHHFMC